MPTDPRSRRALFVLASLALGTTGCIAATPEVAVDYADHDERSDFDALTLGGAFDPNDVVSDAFFRDSTMIDEADVQAFLDASPYGTRSFLADETVSGRSVADVLVATARLRNVNPVLLLARMQVEKGLVSKTVRPTTANTVDFAFGCGCPDGRACNEAYRGLDRQLECAAQTHENRYADSEAGTGQWRRGVARRTVDGRLVTPANHATAALYAYTPHVGLSGSRVVAGNALVHNIAQRYVRHLIALGRMNESDLPDARNPWIGTACDPAAAACDLGRSGESCLPTGDGAGFCTATCEGYCPDRTGHASTFCVSLDGVTGTCVSKSVDLNAHCASLPGTEARDLPRFLGASEAPASTARVCAPSFSPPAPADPAPSDPAPSDPAPSDPAPSDPAPSDPAPSDPAPSDPAPSAECSDTCSYPSDGLCDDGGPGADYSDCALGTDCTDCGPRDPSGGAGACTNTCTWADDGECDDGGPGSAYSVCALGTDCADCGAR